MNKISQNTWLLITIVFAALLTTYALSDIVIHPYHVITELGADGGKNNYTYLYHILYGKGIWFDGMNYPYGEHIVYTDGQPILSVTLSYFKGIITLPAALGIMWGLISLSYVLGIVYTYKVLQHFKVSPLIAMICSGLILVCSPQIFRLSGHYALAYTCFIPMLFYWSVQYYSLNEKKHLLWIFIMGCITVFLHPYFSAVALVWAGCYTAGYLLFETKTFSAKAKHLLPLLASVLGSFIVFGIFIKLTDPVTDRPVTPYGILVNCTHVRDIISSGYSPMWNYVKDHHIYNRNIGSGEGYTYVGLAVLITVGISIVIGLINLAKKRSEKNIVSSTCFQPIWLFIAFAALAFGMGIPFIWHLEWLTDYFSVLKQFRTLGRFSWIFYYVFTVYGTVVMYTWYSKSIASKKPVAGYAIILSALTIWGMEANWSMQHTQEVARVGYERYDIFVSAKEKNWTQFLAEHHYTSENFQAILTLRFFENGSEKLWLGHNEEVSAYAVAESAKASIQLHLPIVDVMMSRTSWAQAFAQVKIAGGPYTDKPMLRDLKSDKPFLLLDIDVEPLEPDQRYLLEASDSIGHAYNCYVYACYPSRIKANDKKYADSIRALLPNISVGDTCIKNTGTWFVQHFNNLKADSAFFGSGAMPYDPAPFTTLATVQLNGPIESQQYELSCWALVPTDNYKSPYINVELLDNAGNILASIDGPAKESTDNHGFWWRDHLIFRIPKNCSAVRCRLGNDSPDSYKIIDELMLRPVDALIISKEKDGSVMVNNHRFKR